MRITFTGLHAIRGALENAHGDYQPKLLTSHRRPHPADVPEEPSWWEASRHAYIWPRGDGEAAVASCAGGVLVAFAGYGSCEGDWDGRALALPCDLAGSLEGRADSGELVLEGEPGGEWTAYVVSHGMMAPGRPRAVRTFATTGELDEAGRRVRRDADRLIEEMPEGVGAVCKVPMDAVARMAGALACASDNVFYSPCELACGCDAMAVRAAYGGGVRAYGAVNARGW